MQDVARPESLPAGEARRAPWTLADIGRALIFPGIFFALNVLAGLLVDEDDQRLSEAELISTYAISMGFQLFLVAMAWAFTVRKYHVPWRALGLRTPERGGWLFVVGLIVGAFFIIYAWVGILLALGIEGNTDLPDGTFDYTSSIILLAVLSLAFAPFVEELFFRGFVFGGLQSRLGLPAGLALGGVVFGLAHAGTPSSFLVLPAIAGVGALFAWSYYYTGSLLAGIIAHFVFNLASVIAGVSAS